MWKWQGQHRKSLWSFIFIVVPYCPSGYALQFGWSDLVIIENFSNLAAQFLLVGACGCACSLSCFQYEFSVFKALRLKVFKCHNKANNLSGVSVKLFFRSKLTNLATLTIELAVMKINSFQQLRIPTKSKQVSK